MNASANMGTVVESPKARRTGSRGRGAATGSNAKAQTARKPQSRKRDDWALDSARYAKLGHEMAEAAVNNVKDAATLWDQARSYYVEAQQHGQAEAAVVALFSAGDEVKGRKAPWYRTYKSILGSAAKLSIAVTNEMGMSALQKEIKAAKDDQQDPEAKKAQLIGMFIRLAKGCLNAGVEKRALVKALTEAEATV